MSSPGWVQLSTNRTALGVSLFGVPPARSRSTCALWLGQPVDRRNHDPEPDQGREGREQQPAQASAVRGGRPQGVDRDPGQQREGEAPRGE